MHLEAKTDRVTVSGYKRARRMDRYTVTAIEQASIRYRCTKCGRDEIFPMQLRFPVMMVFGSNSDLFDRELSTERADRESRRLLTQEIERLTETVNITRNYEKLPKVVCPHCKTRQFWADIPRPWIQLKRYTVWGGAVAACLVTAFAALPGYPAVGFVAIGTLPLLALFPLLRTFRRNKLLRKAEQQSEPLPYFSVLPQEEM